MLAMVSYHAVLAHHAVVHHAVSHQAAVHHAMSHQAVVHHAAVPDHLFVHHQVATMVTHPGATHPDAVAAAYHTVVTEVVTEVMTDVVVAMVHHVMVPRNPC